MPGAERRRKRFHAKKPGALFRREAFSTRKIKIYLLDYQWFIAFLTDACVWHVLGCCFFLVNDIFLFHEDEFSSLYINPYLR